MLPSGNDAAWALAESFGLIIQHLRSSPSHNLPNEILDSESNDTNNPERLFLEEMNKMATKL